MTPQSEGKVDFGFSSIGHKLTAFICVIISLGFAIIVYFYAHQQERGILLQNERAIHQMLNSVSEGLSTVMITGSADIAELYAEKVRGVKDVEDFRVLRTNGLEAFKDNEMILWVNKFRESEDFEPRRVEAKNRLLAADDPNLKKVLETQEFTYFYNRRHDEDHLTFLLPIKNVKKCNRCHGKEKPVLGVLEFSASLKSVHETIRKTWVQSGMVLLVALAAILVVTTLVLRRYIIRPIEIVSNAMDRVSKGDLSQKIPILGKDELSQMAHSFNSMTKELQLSYDGFSTEHNKLQTIIMGTDEGIVVADGFGKVLLVNPSAERLLKKTSAQIMEASFLQLIDDPEVIHRLLEKVKAGDLEPEIVLYHQHFLAIYASTLTSNDASGMDHAFVIRDMTTEKRLEQSLRELSNTDPLTGLLNRRALDETLKAEFELAREQGRELAVLMFDVDHFKKFNDNYGHDQGDRVLKFFAATVREAVREILDTVCRYGGEEFIVIARETSQSGGLILAERIREAIEIMEVDGLKVTTSIGVAGIRETEATDPDDLIGRADAALYEAKRSGRNRVCGAMTGGGTQ